MVLQEPALQAGGGTEEHYIMSNTKSPFRNELHQVDFCVVGGGLSGLCAAVAAARHGARVALMQDRPMLGGNASSEIRMWVCGAHGLNMRETGIIEEIMLDNHYRNPDQNFSLWDSILYEVARNEPNITLILNCSCNAARMKDGRIASITGWQTTTQKWHTVEAPLFADCSGDSVLAPLTGADFRVGREARAEFGEDIGPEKADRCTMGMSCLIQMREVSQPRPFIPPAWANVYKAEDLPNRVMTIGGSGNFWWLELGGEQDSIHDTEEIRDELLKAAFGVWDYLKNRANDPDADRWVLDWVGFLPGKRESRRYLGAHIMTQNDVRAEGRFEDLVAYGGWPMDDHHPGGLKWPGAPTIFHKAPSPYGIPYRSLYSRNVPNLFFAGRNISVTHAALSSTRVMATCAVIGQAVGTAAAIATREKCLPGDIAGDGVRELQQTLLDDDCYLPWQKRDIPALTQRAALTAAAGDPSALRNGVDRPVGDTGNDFVCALDSGWVEYRLPEPAAIARTRLVFDSNLNRNGTSCHYNIRSSYPLNAPANGMPGTLVRAFRIEARTAEGQWRTVAQVTDNRRRMVRLPLDVTTDALRLVPETLWDDAATEARLFAWDIA
ncbi:MAG: FAD-dependent oxidoreductase [Lentisphaerae bacterium]|jgi:hypothetical protein|nr:FAD-dependent oxidoreductase [Lentisphaerota bacterium]